MTIPWIYVGTIVVATLISVAAFLAARKRASTTGRQRCRQEIVEDVRRVKSELAVLMVQRNNDNDSSSSKSELRRENQRGFHELAPLEKGNNDNDSSSGSCTSTKEYESNASLSISWELIGNGNDSCDTETITSLESILTVIDQSLDSDATSLVKLYKNLDDLDTLRLQHPTNPHVLYRLGKCHHRLSENQVGTDSNVIVGHLNDGIDACRLALECQPELPEAHQWLAVLLENSIRNNHLLTTHHRTHYAAQMKEHIESAIRLDPEDCRLHHMLGRCVLEKFVNGSYEEALGHFLRADELSEVDWQLNKLYIGRCRIGLGDVGRGVEVLRDAVGIVRGPGHVTREDREAFWALRELLDEYS